MDSVLSILAMVACLLVLGWLVGSGDEPGKHARPHRAEPQPSPPSSSPGSRPGLVIESPSSPDSTRL